MDKKTLTIIILAAIIGGLLLFNFNCRKVEKPVIITVKEQAKAVKNNEAVYKVTADSLVGIVQKLAMDKTILQNSLAYYQVGNKLLGQEAVNQIRDTFGTTPDIQQKAVSDLVNNNAISDSLCNATIANLDLQLDASTALSVLKDSMYIHLRQSFDTALRQQTILTDYSKKLETKVKWTQVGRFAWKGAAIVGGLLLIRNAVR